MYTFIKNIKHEGEFTKICNIKNKCLFWKNDDYCDEFLEVLHVHILILVEIKEVQVYSARRFTESV